jgi:hypothetical protein
MPSSRPLAGKNSCLFCGSYGTAKEAKRNFIGRGKATTGAEDRIDSRGLRGPEEPVSGGACILSFQPTVKPCTFKTNSDDTVRLLDRTVS